LCVKPNDLVSSQRQEVKTRHLGMALQQVLQVPLGEAAVYGNAGFITIGAGAD
jgi:hypothetical protein